MQLIKLDCKLVSDNSSWSCTVWLNQVGDTYNFRKAKVKFYVPLMNITSVYQLYIVSLYALTGSVRLFQAFTDFASLRQALPGYARVCQAIPDFARLCDFLYHGLPCSAMLCHALPCSAMLCLALPGSARLCQVLLGTFRLLLWHNLPGYITLAWPCHPSHWLGH